MRSVGEDPNAKSARGGSTVMLVASMLAASMLLVSSTSAATLAEAGAFGVAPSGGPAALVAGTGSPARVTTQPVSETVKLNAPATFSVGCSGSPAPTVQWEVSSEGSPFTPIEGATKGKLRLGRVTREENGDEYRATCANSEGEETSEAATLTIRERRLTINNVRPPRGVAAGGTEVLLTLDATASNITSVEFGSTPASFHPVASQQILAISPPGVAGSRVSITIIGVRGSETKQDAFKYGPPTITGVSPASGPEGGGNQVTASGSGFVPGADTTVFKVGSAEASSVECESTTSCVLTMPPASLAHHKPGTVDIKTSINGYPSKKNSADEYTYE